jgi:transcriptional regulator with XRE-family HTH domain
MRRALTRTRLRDGQGTIDSVDGRIGAELRQERRARGIELEEVEAATGVRARFLEAIEEEAWERLPGEFYARAFTRTYAGYLGLDPAEFALAHRPDSVAAAGGGPRVEPRLVPEAPSARQPRRWLPVAAALAAVALVAVAVVVIVSVGGGGSTGPSAPSSSGAERAGAPPQAKPKQATEPPGTSLRLTATAEVWVCLLNGGGKPLIDGEILQPGSEAGPFHSRRYSMAFGNGAVELSIDGSPQQTPETSSPIGFSVGTDGTLRQIPEGGRPECA